ncbi:lipopolysaccharide biosynthesis protein RfbH [Clostridium sp. W14A]|nr:lipopolysaccharide biosynthesis protein RfbH [Clostridium sp. W14A]
MRKEGGTVETEESLRREILEKTKEIFKLRQQEEKFIPGKSRIHYAGRVFDEREMQAAVDCALDFWLTLGEKGDRFVSDFSRRMGMNYGLVTNSGSSANLLAVGALCSPNLAHPLRPGDEVITTALAFPTTLNPILQYGLIPVFVDVEEGTYNLDAGRLESALSDRTRAVVLAHTLGNPAEMDRIMEFAKEHSLYVLEDTCDALDSFYDGKRCGTFGDLSTYSFYAAHHITMGEGGALLTNSLNLYRQALSLRDWGRACYCRTGERNPNGACGHRFDQIFDGLPDGYDHKYVYSNIGYNLKPLDLQCAVGVEQLKKLPEFTKRRRENFETLFNGVKQYEEYFILPRALPKAEPSWFAFPLTVRGDAPFTRKELVTYLEQNQIETRMLFAGNILRHPGYRNIRSRTAGELIHTEKALNGSFFIGVYPGITNEMIHYILDVLRRFLSQSAEKTVGTED